jgi:hypothetical protein
MMKNKEDNKQIWTHLFIKFTLTNNILTFIEALNSHDTRQFR